LLLREKQQRLVLFVESESDIGPGIIKPPG